MSPGVAYIVKLIAVPMILALLLLGCMWSTVGLWEWGGTRAVGIASLVVLVLAFIVAVALVVVGTTFNVQ